MIKMRPIITAMTVFLLLCSAFAHGQDVNLQGSVARIATSSGDDAQRIAEDTISNCKTYDDYEKVISEIKDIVQNPDSGNRDVLFYSIAKARLEQLELLSKDNSIEAGRQYMSVSYGYRSEALDSLDKALESTKSKRLRIDSIFLKYLMAKEGFQPQMSDSLLDELANNINNYSDDRNLNKSELLRIGDMLKDKGLSDDALRLISVYGEKAGREGAQGMLEDVKSNADKNFSQGNMKEASRYYEYYITEGQSYLSKDAMAANVMDIAERYYAANKFREAWRYYEFYAATYPDSKVLDYCRYKIALCYYNENDYLKAASSLEDFLKDYKASVWYDKAFETLCRLYYSTSPRDAAIKNLQRLLDNYYRKNTGDYAYLLIGLLQYGDKNYNGALQTLKKMDSDSVYSNAADTLVADIKNIRENRGLPAFSFGSKDNYKAWEPHTAVIAKLMPAEPGLEVTETASGTPQITVATGTKIKFTLSGLADVDRYAEYMQDKEDISRLPKKIKEEVEKDILYIQWTCDGGKFTDEKQGADKNWEAPSQLGTYKVSATIDDLGLVRTPDRGLKKDPTKELGIIVVVK